MYLLEIVLHTPIEAVLAPYINHAPTDDTKKWIAANFRNWLMKTPENLYRLPYLPSNATEQQKKAFSFNDLYDIRLSPRTQSQLEHILDFFDNNQELPQLARMSVENVVQAADQWVKRINAKALKQPDDPAQVKTLKEFPGDFRIVELVGKEALEREGALMGHCVGGGSYWDAVRRGQDRIFSLRDANNEPRVTIEVALPDMTTQQIKGRSNRAPVRRYWPMLREFFAEAGITVEGDYNNVGLLQVSTDDSGDRYARRQSAETMTQEQFKDMVLDPTNARGQQILNMYLDPKSQIYFDDDIALGIFSALYGSDKLTDRIIKHVFDRMPEHGVQVIEHYGNRLTPPQLMTVFTSISGRTSELANLFKGLLIATKPDAALVSKIMTKLANAEAFVVALFQVLPDTYTGMLLKRGKASIQKELAENNDRAAGPFFVFVGKEQLTPEMIEKAFEHLPGDAMKRIQRVGLTMDRDAVLAGFKGLSHHYWGRTSELDPILDRYMLYTKPDESILRNTFGKGARRDSEYAAKVLLSARKHVPEALAKDTIEEALISIDSDKMYQEYLQTEQAPSGKLQRHLFAKDKESFGARLWGVHHIDPSIFPLALAVLRPDPIEVKTKEDYKNVRNKTTGSYNQVKFTRQKTAEELQQEAGANRREAINRFTKLLSPLLREPTSQAYDTNRRDTTDHVQPLDPQSPKFQAGQKAFTKLGKEKLFDVAVQIIDRHSMMADIGSGNRYNRQAEQQTFDKFIKNLDKLTTANIVDLINSVGYHNELFALLINHAPERVPAVLVRGLKHAYYGRGDQYGQYGKLDWKGLDKEKTFDALEYIWMSMKVPEKIKDDFTLKVFKRFKPSNERLMVMLTTADNEEATRYVLKKTKKPSVELLDFVFANFPNLLIDVPDLPDKLLVRIFQENMQLALALMDRDLRGYGSDDNRSKWATKSYRAKLDRKSAVFAKYAAVAKAADKEKVFERYTRQTELDDMVPPNKAVTMPFVIQHLDEFSNRTLLKIASNATKNSEIIKLYFDHFSTKRLAVLASHNLLNPGGGWREIEKGVLNQLDQPKLRAMILLLADIKERDNPIDKIVKAMQKERLPIDDELIKVLFKAKDVSMDSEFKASLISGPNVSDDLKNFIADHFPYEMDDIAVPNAHMVAKLFDEFGKVETGSEKNKVNWFFSKTVISWFSTDNLWFRYKPNPVAAKLLQAEGVKRMGLALVLTRSVLQHINDLRKQAKNNLYVSSGEYEVKMLPAAPAIR